MTGAIVDVRSGESPLILSMPHVGTGLTPDAAERLNETGRAVGDTDWWMDRLYGFADDLDPTVIRARLSRYVIDVNRDPSGASLYPGQATTGLCPTTTFDGDPLYRPGMEPDDAEIARRRAAYHAPYHAALAAEIERVRQARGYALLYDCHSIRSVIPRLFPGTLPTFNIGTNSGASCAREIEAAVAEACSRACARTPHPGPPPQGGREGAGLPRRADAAGAGEAAGDGGKVPPPPLRGRVGVGGVGEALENGTALSYALNGRFKGGYITRHHGRPAEHVHAVQMELAQSAYMLESPPWTYDETAAGRTRPVLRRVLEAMLDAGARLYGGKR